MSKSTQRAAQSSALDELRAAKASVKPRATTAIDRFLAERPEQRALLMEFLDAFASERSWDFGWKHLAALLEQKVDGFPKNTRRLALQRWAEANHPAFGGGEGR